MQAAGGWLAGAPLSLISFLVPIYQAEATLDHALRSLAWQTDPDWEAVLVDDGSTDRSAALAAAWADRDPRFRLLREPHRGLVATLNRGLELCRGSWVARMDADDVSHPRRLERQRQVDADVVGCRVRLFPSSLLKSGFRRYERWLNSLLSHPAIERDLYVESPLVHPSVLVRRDWLERVGGYRDRGWAEDYDLWLRLWEAGARFGKADQVLLWWRESPSRLTRSHADYGRPRILALKVESLLRTWLRDRPPVVVWGAGDEGKRLARALRAQGVEVRAFADLNRGRIGMWIDGSPVFSPRETAYPEGCFHLAAVGRDGGRALVREEMAAFGLVEGKDFICLA